MSALNFTVFIAEVEKGTKRQTIRARRKRLIKVGEWLHLFTGMRTKMCRRLWVKELKGTRLQCAPRCKRVRDIEMTFKSARSALGTYNVCFRSTVKVDGELIGDSEVWAIAEADGFNSKGQFLAFFFQATKPNKRERGTTKFKGQIINW